MEGNKQLRMIWKLKELKKQTKIWVTKLKAQDSLLLDNLKLEIEQVLLKSIESPLSLEDDRHLRELEINRNNFLCREEETWRIRSRATWIKNGDFNTIVFHKMGSFNRNRKHVWDLIKDNGDNLTN